MSAPALGLPEMRKPFFLFSHENLGIALGIPAQNLGPYWRAVAYLSKELDMASKGWPGCLRAIAAVSVNIQEAHKFTLGQKMTMLVSHAVSAVLEVKGGHWLSPQRFLKYQAVMVEYDDVDIVVTNIVNPASFLREGMGGIPCLGMLRPGSPMEAAMSSVEEGMLGIHSYHKQRGDRVWTITNQHLSTEG
ncbi:hypothetical protein DUI87_04958 [Hirundo rustica rustica]|uniref:Reverse transcriptase RNase H-like domain-containing protein n=1 Tax=Hirundo rustica rustica TaxID=333673 RepID=A0A3M0KXQ0_HIRRU|nr:hypothetical protein DUI87_04958 [Hirundo rustica rustica]